MSEQQDMEANNLCISEDAFEKFQAVSMYQAEECLLLRKENPPNQYPSQAKKKNEPPNINDEVVSSCNEMNSSVNKIENEDFSKQPLSSPCVESSAGLEEQSGFFDSSGKVLHNTKEINYENDMDMVVSNSENINNHGNTILESLSVNSTLVSQKRGRKPKKPAITSTALTTGMSRNVQNPDISSTPFSSDPESLDTPTAVRKKRGRPRRVQHNEQFETSFSISDKDQTTDLSSSDNKCENLPVKKSIRSKRGRPKKDGEKLSTDINMDLRGSPPGSDNQTQKEIIPGTDEASTNFGKGNEIIKNRKRKLTMSNLSETELDDNNIKPDSSKVISDNISDNDEFDDICLSKLKTAPEQLNSSNSAKETANIQNRIDCIGKDSTSEHIEGQSSKPKKKRGRPKKNQSAASLSQFIQTSESVADHASSIENSHIKDDEADELCLSKLKAVSTDGTSTKSVSEPPNREIKQSTDPDTPKDSKSPTRKISVSDAPVYENQVSAMEINKDECNETPTKRNTKMAVMADFEYNIDSVLGNKNENADADDSLLVEDASKRPMRRKVKKFRYEEESDEDPFANIELSDDEPRRGKKGSKYYSDDEYIPGKSEKGAFHTSHTSTDSEMSDNDMQAKLDDKKQRKKKWRKKSDNQSPRKKGKKDDEIKSTTSDVTFLELKQEMDQSGDIEICLDSSVIKTSDGESQNSQPSQKWGASTEFENFLAKKIQGTNLKIKKVSANVPTDSNKIEIPVLDLDAKKTIEMCTQTNAVSTSSIAVQTVTPYDIPMKENVSLTSEQSEKACFFLNSIVKTTAELGLLMTQKSEDFIKKKINTNHVTDTAKMDYCVKKSFLLFKLAKHNLLQMEEDLSKQYEEFLEANNLTRCREEQKEVTPTPKEVNSDSDCEIVDVEPSPQSQPAPKTSAKPAFNPKTVFLNKELSIKIAKKPSDNKKLDIKGRHTVWINDTVMVKKVKPTQSFLAQDSRNKKPPDNLITKEMVSDFFKNYYRHKALSACAPFVTTEWLNVHEEIVCNYFVVKPLQYNTDDNYSNDGFNINTAESTTTISESVPNLSSKNIVTSSPDTLFTLCFLKIKNQLCCNGLNHFEITHETRCALTDNKKQPESLFRLCLKIINNSEIDELVVCSTSSKPEPFHNVTVNTSTLKSLCNIETVGLNTTPSLKSLCHKRIVELIMTPPLTSPAHRTVDMITIPPLKTICLKRIVELMSDSNQTDFEYKKKEYSDIPCSSEDSNETWLTHPEEIIQIENTKNEIKSLFSLCVACIQRMICIVDGKNNVLTPKSLKKIALENVTHLLYMNDFIENDEHDEQPSVEGLMINCVNTLSEEAFLSLEQYNTDIPESPEYLDDYNNEDCFGPDLTEDDGDHTEPSWVTQVQMQELRSCVTINNIDVNEQPEKVPIITQIKLEPLDEITENFLDSVHVKSEPVPGPDEMTIIPDVKPEIEEHIQSGPIQRQNSHSYDGDAFEHFVSNNKLIQSLTQNSTEEIYSQSSARVRKQHEPDYYEEGNADMLGLLVPHTYEPMSIQTVKGSLLESSSDESSKNVKNVSKKGVKRSRGRPKKIEQKSNNKDKLSIAAVPAPNTTFTPTPTPLPAPTTASAKEKEKQKGQNSEVAVLTRKMREKIRQEEKQNESSDSENENITVRLRSREKKDTIDQTKDKAKSNNKSKGNEIQCNNIDSTDLLDENIDTFTGFTPIETNEMSNYEKYMKYVYEKVIPGKDEIQKDKELLNTSKVTEENTENVSLHQSKELLDSNDKKDTSVISPDEPVELLECEPTLPIFDEISEKGRKGLQKKTKTVVPVKSVVPAEIGIAPEVGTLSKISPAVEMVSNVSLPQFVDRHGWHCYPLQSEDTKLYQNACIYLEKLPDSFVKTYFQYQNISTKDKSDEEIERLTNLNSLNRATNIIRKIQNSSKRDTKDDQSGNISDDNSRTLSAMDSDHCNELMPSDDEVPKIEVEIPPPAPKQTENTLAKNLLMNDNDSDDDIGVRVKKEFIETSVENNTPKPLCKKKAVKTVVEPTEMMLTADKMMNKELTLLHAPVVMDDKAKDTPTKGPVTRHTKKSGTKPSPPPDKIKAEDDSSSEEEKQWVSTKEKLLKRMGKKESSSADDAKRAKLVSEFIERRECNPTSRKTRGIRARRSGKKFLERQKQLRVLQRELFGETSNDPTVTKRSGAAWKGRRNIRKVLDKKSLARSTVIANMEEFERKRRLNTRQTKLRELLGCEEGVNVLVINDEVCLEYDFEEHRPVVTIHPFFTKVMKAHQYEGVKFMWDACFESLADIEGGHAGGGCILAHCMGLGKTLQVLALLHTVLTHPRVGMQRVLVCCPLSTVLNWVDEIHKWIGPVTNQIKVFELSKLRKTYERAYQLEDWYNGGGIFIIGYELFRSLSTLDAQLDDVRPTIVNKIRTALLDPGPDIIVCDEGHLLKNDCSVLAVSMSRVVTRRRIMLTGTPMQNNLREYYCMVNFVKPNLLGTYAEYSNRFENPIMNGQHRDSQEEDIKLMKARTHILHKVLEGCLQRQEVSVLYPYLPKKHEYTVFITLTKCQWDLYKHYLNHYSRQMKQNSILKDFHILQKIWSHPQVLHNFQIKAQESRNKIRLEKLEDDLATEDQEDIKDVATELWWLQYLEGGNMLDSLEVSNKFVVVFRILDECVALDDKVLIFSTSLFCLDALEYFLRKINKWSLGQEYYRLDGSVPPEVRQKWCREFNADSNVNTKLFLISTRAGCLGLNMTAANRVIIMDTSWNPAHDIQSIFRVYRFGQKKDCYIYRLVAMGTMEQKIYERSVTKQAVACRVVDEQQIDRHYNMDELTELYRYDEAGVSVAPGVAVGVRDVVLLRVARETALHAVHEHDSLLRSSEQGLPEHERAAAWMQFQQEQAHKQMENKLIANIPKISLKRVQGNNYSQTIELDDIKIKSEDHTIDNSSEDFVQPTEVKNKRGKKINKIIEPIPPKTPANLRVTTRSSRQKNKIDNVQEPSTSNEHHSQHIDKQNCSEKVVVEKITEILIKHGFQNRKGNGNISSLLANVRKIVYRGYIYKDDGIDDLTISIAKVLLSQNMTMPALTDIMCESINKSDNPANTQEEPEEILSTITEAREVNTYDRRIHTSEEILSTITEAREVNTYDNRRKRKAAIAAEKHIDSIAHDVIINLDDEFDATDTDFVPDKIDKPEKSQINKRKSSRVSTPQKRAEEEKRQRNTISPPPHSSTIDTQVAETSHTLVGADGASIAKTKSLLRNKAGPKTFKDKLRRKLAEPTTHEPSPPDEQVTNVLLDDDDGSLPLTDKDRPFNVSIPDAASTAISREDQEAVPLPLSLLTNKNFINIVAHTYLNGNPMLDADAATLAAQYSTYKSLKEAEQTGRDITSGPIYDIAVKVIGKNLFKKMNVANVQKNLVPVDEASVTIELKEKMQEMSERKPRKPRKQEFNKKKPVNSENLDSDIIEVESPEPADNQCATGNVVPVGLIKTTGSIQANEFASSECILPDDDDAMHIVPHDLPALPQLQPAPAVALPPPGNLPPPDPTPSLPRPTKPKQIILKRVKPSKNIIAEMKPMNVIKISNGKIIMTAAVTSDNGNSSQSKLTAAPPPPTPPAQSSDDTICLDSDEEETITPTLTTPRIPTSQSIIAPVPVSLTVGQPPEILSTPSSIMPVTSVQSVPKQHLVIRQVGSTPKLVLVPANSIETSAGPKVLKKEQLPKEKSTSQSAPHKPNTTYTEPRLSTTVPSAACLEKIRQVCGKPGDIIKISEKGGIEVVQVDKLKSYSAKKPSHSEVISKPTQSEHPKPKTATNTEKSKSSLPDVPKPKTQSNVAKTKPTQTYVGKSNSSYSEPAKVTTNLTKPSQTEQYSYEVVKPQMKKPTKASDVPKEVEQSKTRTLSISSSSSESRPSSPVDNNPLSILKNVVHIQAADEIPSSSSASKSNVTKNHKSNDANIFVRHVHATDPKNSAATVISKTKESNLKITKGPSKSTEVEKSSSKAKVINKTSTEKVLSTLMDTKTLTLKNNKTVDNKSPKLTTVLKTSAENKKENKTNSTNNRTYHTVDLTQFSTVTAGSGASILKTKIEAKKRVSTAETSAPKRKKPELPTLKDFSLDDIDDIIELD